MDENRANGKSMIGIPTRVKQLQVEIAKLEHEYSLERTMNDELYVKLGYEESEPWVSPLKNNLKDSSDTQQDQVKPVRRKVAV